MKLTFELADYWLSKLALRLSVPTTGHDDFLKTILVHGQVTIIFVVSVGLSVCFFVCLFVQSFSQPSLIRFQSN